MTNLFALHRLSTMGERRTYYDRRLEAELNPSLFLSTFADGMQQTHCMLPWYGKSKTPSHHVKQHLQGVYMHGDNMTIYRTFANVGGGANLAIHTWLMSLEDYSRRHKDRLPRVLYHQIDGGPENANVEFLAVCALLVACGVFDKIVLTRLPVGHTHEDIDALFALIWKRLRDEHIYTPDEFAKMACDVLKRKIRVNVVDVFALPDYVTLLKDCIDPSLSRFSKEEWAQLQFTFEAVDVCDKYPTGVKTTYRAYTQDSFIEIVEDDGDQSVCGLVPQECIVRSRPLPGEPVLNILKRLPTSDILPAPFIAGSREIIENVSSRMISQFEKSRASVADEWRLWASTYAPLTDNVQDYLTTNCGAVPAASYGTQFLLREENLNEGGGGIYLPFKTRMFSESAMSDFDVSPRLRGVRSDNQARSSSRGVAGNIAMRVVESTTSVLHQENKNAAARRTGSRNVLFDETGQVPAEPKTALNSVYPGRAERRAGAATRRRQQQEAKQSSSGDDEAKRSCVTGESEDRRCVAETEHHPVSCARTTTTEQEPDEKQRGEREETTSNSKNTHGEEELAEVGEKKQNDAPPHSFPVLCTKTTSSISNNLEEESENDAKREGEKDDMKEGATPVRATPATGSTTTTVTTKQGVSNSKTKNNNSKRRRKVDSPPPSSTKKKKEEEFE